MGQFVRIITSIARALFNALIVAAVIWPINPALAQLREQTDGDRAGLSPFEKIAGENEFTMTVHGVNFTPETVLRLNGQNRPTTFVDSGELQAIIYASDIAVAGNFAVTVFTPPPGGGESNSLIFVVLPKTSTAKIAHVVHELRANPTVVGTAKNIASPAAVTITAISAGTLTITSSVGSATFAANASQFIQHLSLLRFYALGLLRFRRRRPWGKILNTLTGAPINGARVTIFNSENYRARDSQLTDREGRFTTLLPTGQYLIEAVREGFETRRLGPVKIDENESIADLEIRLSPLTAIPSLALIKKISFFYWLKNLLEILNPYLLAIGTVISLAVAIVVPSTLNYAGFLIYLGLDFLKIYLAVHLIRPFGTIINSVDQQPVALAVVRIFEADKSLLLATKVTDDQGRFNFLLTPGNYYLTCAKENFKRFQSSIFRLGASQLVTPNVKLEPLSS